MITGASQLLKHDITSTLLTIPRVKSQFSNSFKSVSLAVEKSGLKSVSASGMFKFLPAANSLADALVCINNLLEYNLDSPFAGEEVCCTTA